MNENIKLLNNLINKATEEINSDVANKILNILESMTKSQIIDYEKDNKLNIEISMYINMYKLFENGYICNNINNTISKIIVYHYFQSYDEVTSKYKKRVEAIKKPAVFGIIDGIGMEANK